jgi:hypothetical protein
MNTASITDDDPRAAPKGLGLRHDVVLVVALALLVAAAWAVGRAGFFEAGDDLGYTLGVAGGVLMLVAAAVPGAQVPAGAAQRAGKVKRSGSGST